MHTNSQNGPRLPNLQPATFELLQDVETELKALPVPLKEHQAIAQKFGQLVAYVEHLETTVATQAAKIAELQKPMDPPTAG